MNMIFRQSFDKISSTYTYLIASRKGGEALIIDPVLDKTDQYIKLLEQLDLRLVKVIDTHIVYDDASVWPLELSSGMERFISSLAIRVGLMNVSNLPRSNFLAIDEGWGTMDSENLNSVSQLFQYLKSQFQFSLVVSHIESMRDFVDTLLEIKKVSGLSSVRFSRD